MFGWPVFSHGGPQRLDDPSGIGAFQRSDAHDLAGAMVDNHQDLDRPQAPTQIRLGDLPDEGGDLSRCRVRGSSGGFLVF